MKVKNEQLDAKLDKILDNQVFIGKELGRVQAGVITLLGRTPCSPDLVESLTSKLIEMAMVNQGKTTDALAARRLTPANQVGESAGEIAEEVDWFNVP